VIAVDGPSGSGKSSVCREVARRLGLQYLDTGAMYRALCWWCLQTGVHLVDSDAVARAAAVIDLQLGTDPDDLHVRVHGRPVDAFIRTGDISAAVSLVATNLGVRAEMVRRQQALVAELSTPPAAGVVVEGRDITTVVAPQAPVRVLLTADEDARLARRAAEVHGHADEHTVAATRDQVLRRDADDATVSSFHTAADGVVTLDSSVLTLDQTVEAMLAVVAERVGSPQ
jgi:cytidylate kinase